MFFMTVLLAALCTVTAFSSCSDDDDYTGPPEQSAKAGRTVLVYMWGDIDNVELCAAQLEYINRMEKGWDDSFDGSLYVYLDPSPRFVQFSKPVLIKIRHDESPAIVSEVVKTFEPIDKHGDITRYPEVQKYVRSIAPADSYGLMLFGHGSGARAFDPEEATRGIGGNEQKYMENWELGENTLSGYEFVVLHACIMANVEAVYELRDKTEYVVGSEISLSATGWPWDLCMSYLYTKPKADLSGFIMKSAAWLYENQEDADKYSTMSLIDATKLEALAKATKKALTESGVTRNSIMANVKKYHFVERYDTDVTGPDVNILKNHELLIDLKEYMARNSACTKEWEEAFNDVCPLSFNRFAPGLDMSETNNVDGTQINFYNGLSVYSGTILKYAYEQIEDIKAYYECYRKHQWVTDSGFGDIDDWGVSQDK